MHPEESTDRGDREVSVMQVGTEGREARFRALYERTHLQVLSYCLRRTAEREDALDAAAETFVVAWRRFDDLPSGSDGDRLVYLFGIARRVLANQRRAGRRQARVRGRLRDTDPGGGPLSPESRMLESEEQQRVLRAMARLSDDDQELLRLDTWEELSARELAQHLGCTENALYVRLHRARQRLARAFDREGRMRRQSRGSAEGGDVS